MSKSMSKDSKNLVPTKKSKFHLKLGKLTVEAKKHERFLENNFLFIGLHLTVNQACYLLNLDVKSD